MKKPKDVDKELWQTFEQWCKNYSIDINDSEDDVGMWWACFRDGYDQGYVMAYDTIRGAIG